jgi:hypothetical protein
MSSHQKGKEPSKKRKAESESDDEESKREWDLRPDVPCALHPKIVVRKRRNYGQQRRRRRR